MIVYAVLCSASLSGKFGAFYIKKYTYEGMLILQSTHFFIIRKSEDLPPLRRSLKLRRTWGIKTGPSSGKSIPGFANFCKAFCKAGANLSSVKCEYEIKALYIESIDSNVETILPKDFG